RLVASAAGELGERLATIRVGLPDRAVGGDQFSIVRWCEVRPRDERDLRRHRLAHAVDSLRTTSVALLHRDLSRSPVALRWSTREPNRSRDQTVDSPDHVLLMRDVTLTSQSLDMTSRRCHDGVMDLTPYIDGLQRDLAASAAPGGPDVTRAAQLLGGSIEASARLLLLEALSDAAAEI